MNPFPVVWAEVRRSRLGVLAVVCLVAVAVALGVAVSAQERALRRGSARAADAFDLLIGAPGSPTQLVLSAVYLQPASMTLVSGELLRQLAQEAGAEYAAPIAFGDFHRGHPVVGSAAAFVTQGGRLALAEGRVFERLPEAVVGSDVELPLGYRFRPSHGQTGSGDAEHVHEGLEYVVVGRLPRQGTPWDRAIVAPVEALWWVHGLPTGHRDNDALLAAAHEHDGAKEGHKGAHAEKDADHAQVDLAAFRIGPPWDGAEIAGVPAIVVKPRSVGDAYRLRGKYRTASSVALFPAEVLLELYGLLGDARTVLAWIAVATQVLVIAAILLAVFATIALRRKPLAVLRALGASRPYLFLVVWVHVSGMVLAGAGLGLALGWAGAAALSHLFSLKTGILLPVSLGRPEILMVLALVGAGCLLAAIPSWSSYRHPVSSALRN